MQIYQQSAITMEFSPPGDRIRLIIIRSGNTGFFSLIRENKESKKFKVNTYTQSQLFLVLRDYISEKDLKLYLDNWL